MKNNNVRFLKMLPIFRRNSLVLKSSDRISVGTKQIRQMIHIHCLTLTTSESPYKTLKS